MYVWLFLPFISEQMKIGIKHQWKSYQVCFGGDHGLFGLILAALLHAVLGSAISRGWVEDESAESRSEPQPFCIPPHFCYCCQMNTWVVEHRVQNECLDLRFRTFSLDIDSWALSGETFSASVGRQASCHISQDVVDGGVDKADVSTAAPDRRTLLCSWMDQV